MVSWFTKYSLESGHSQGVTEQHTELEGRHWDFDWIHGDLVIHGDLLDHWNCGKRDGIVHTGKYVKYGKVTKYIKIKSSRKPRFGKQYNEPRLTCYFGVTCLHEDR